MQAARGASLTSDTGSGSGPNPEPNSEPNSGVTTTTSRAGLILAIAVLAWGIDLATKIVAQHQLADRGPVDVIGSLLRLNLTRNPGAAFSAGTSITPVISVFACVALVVVALVARRVRTTTWAWAIGLLLAGIAGNLTDRLFREPGPLRGHVVDFLELPHWPIFNVADICINVAAALIILQSLRSVPLGGRARAQTPPAGADS
ncbi:MAG: peptidase signal peptidase [Marmoricola sp.]|nr:peptidase signal peptidase [Marmoricola sp.]